jgi:hypothetical protein
MPEETYVTEAMQSIIGKPFGEAVSYPIARSDIRKWAIAVYYPDPPPMLYIDEEYAKSTSYGGIVAPEDFNPFAWISAQPGLSSRRVSSATDGINSDYLENMFGVEGPGLGTPLNAGAVTEYGVRMRPEDVVSTSSQVVSYTERAGRMGRMLITITRATWTNQAGEMVKLNDQTSIRY